MAWHCSSSTTGDPAPLDAEPQRERLEVVEDRYDRHSAFVTSNPGIEA